MVLFSLLEGSALLDLTATISSVSISLLQLETLLGMTVAISAHFVLVKLLRFYNFFLTFVQFFTYCDIIE
tara:strand:- start:1148 stop:1357 length:210 start_codon:yes stop_codon:yes gene_type:complete